MGKERQPDARLIEERLPLVDPTESTEESWREYLAQFRANVFPMMAEHGIDFRDALILWQLSKIENQLQELNERLDERDAL